MSTSFAMTAMVIVDMLFETTVHIVNCTAVAVAPGYTWTVGVSFRRMNRPPTPTWARR